MAKNILCDDVEREHFDEIIPYVAVNVIGVPAGVVGHAIRLSAIEFAQRTKAIKRTMYLSTQCGVRHYPLQVDDCNAIIAIEDVSYCGSCLRLSSVSCCMSGGFWYAFERPDDFYIGIEPDRDGQRDLEIRAVVMPGQDSCFLDKWVYDLHAETIAQGALYRILKMQAEEWFNPAMSSLAAREFNAGVTRALSLELSHNSTQPQRIQMPRGFLV